MGVDDADRVLGPVRDPDLLGSRSHVDALRLLAQLQELESLARLEVEAGQGVGIHVRDEGPVVLGSHRHHVTHAPASVHRGLHLSLDHVHHQ